MESRPLIWRRISERFVSTFEPPEAVVDCCKVKVSRIPGAADPFFHGFVLLVLGIAERLEEVALEARDAAGIFRRTRVRARQTDWMLELWIGWKDFFEEEVVNPTVAEIVFVKDFSFGRGQKVGDSEPAFIVHLASERFVVRLRNSVGGLFETRANMILMKMAIGPAHHDLQDRMEPIEFKIRTDQYSTPNRRRGMLERDLELVDRIGAAGFSE